MRSAKTVLDVCRAFSCEKAVSCDLCPSVRQLHPRHQHVLYMSVSARTISSRCFGVFVNNTSSAVERMDGFFHNSAQYRRRS